MSDQETVEKADDNPEREALADSVHAAAVELGRRGGVKGGPARAAKLSGQQRRESAEKAATARWAKRPAAPEATEDQPKLKVMFRCGQATFSAEGPERTVARDFTAFLVLLRTYGQAFSHPKGAV